MWTFQPAGFLKDCLQSEKWCLELQMAELLRVDSKTHISVWLFLSPTWHPAPSSASFQSLEVPKFGVRRDPGAVGRTQPTLHPGISHLTQRPWLMSAWMAKPEWGQFWFFRAHRSQKPLSNTSASCRHLHKWHRALQGHSGGILCRISQWQVCSPVTVFPLKMERERDCTSSFSISFTHKAN